MGFKSIFSEGKKALIPYLTYADPNPQESERLMRIALDNGASILEIGLPFSDPIADGPVIQASHKRALAFQPNLTNAFDLLARLKKDYTQPIVFMGSFNLIFRYGVEAFFKKAQKQGLDGVILPDLAFEEAEPYLDTAKRYGVPIIQLVSPLCTEDRLKRIVTAAEGFVYLISSTGTTGERDVVSDLLPALVDRIKAIKDIPVAVGFGIKTREHVLDVFRYADGAIVGSALVKLIEKDDAGAVLESKIRQLANLDK